MQHRHITSERHCGAAVAGYFAWRTPEQEGGPG